MLYGISLLAGLLEHGPPADDGRCSWPTSSAQPTCPASELMVLALGGLLISVGLAFKLSAVPFHFWCPDVFEGATAEVNAFLSIASQGRGAGPARSAWRSASATIPPEGFQPGERTAAMKAAAATAAASRPPRCFNVADEPRQAAERHATAERSHMPTPELPRSQPVRSFTAKLIAFFAIITCTFGNLAAYGQNNLKRLLAYSTIAHAGYMMMPVAAAVAMAGIDNAGAERAIAGAGDLHGRLSVHEPGRVCGRRLPAQRDAERGARRLRRPDPPLAADGDLLRARRCSA